MPPAPITAIVQEGSDPAAGSKEKRGSVKPKAPQSSTEGDVEKKPSKQRRSSTSGAKKTGSGTSGSSDKEEKKPSSSKKEEPKSAKVSSAEKGSDKDKAKSATGENMSSGKRDKDRERRKSRKSRPAQNYDDLKTPEPSSESGMRFDELYRLKGVVSSVPSLYDTLFFWGDLCWV